MTYGRDVYTLYIHMSTIQKWGNSFAVRIPRPIARSMRLREGSAVEMTSEGGLLILRPAKRARRSLSALLKGVTPSNRHSESSWGSPRGREIW